MAKQATIDVTTNPKLMKQVVNDAAKIVIMSVQDEIARMMKLANNEIEYETLNNLNVWLSRKLCEL